MRIWRVTPTDGTTEPILNLATATVPQLVAALGNQNLHWRLQAQRLLIEKGWSAELGNLLEAILKTDRSVDAVGNNPRVVHALWTLHGLGQFAADAANWDPILAGLLNHPAWGVRRNVAAGPCPAPRPRPPPSTRNCSVNDPHGHVRLQALVAFSEISGKPAGLKAMWDSLQERPTRHAQTRLRRRRHHLRRHAPAARPSTRLGAAGRARRRPSPAPICASSVSRDGFGLLPHGQLPRRRADRFGRRAAGVVFRSAYNARAARWTRDRPGG